MSVRSDVAFDHKSKPAAIKSDLDGSAAYRFARCANALFRLSVSTSDETIIQVLFLDDDTVALVSFTRKTGSNVDSNARRPGIPI